MKRNAHQITPLPPPPPIQAAHPHVEWKHAIWKSTLVWLNGDYLLEKKTKVRLYGWGTKTCKTIFSKPRMPNRVKNTWTAPESKAISFDFLKILHIYGTLKLLCQVAVRPSQTKPTCSNIKTSQTQSQRFQTNVAKCPIFLLEFHRIRGPLSVLVRGYLCMKNLLSMPVGEELDWRHLALWQ